MHLSHGERGARARPRQKEGDEGVMGTLLKSLVQFSTRLWAES